MLAQGRRMWVVAGNLARRRCRRLARRGIAGRRVAWVCTASVSGCVRCVRGAGRATATGGAVPVYTGPS